MAPYIRKHQPLITPRVSFRLETADPLPTITPRIEFIFENVRHPGEDEEDSATGGTQRAESEGPDAADESQDAASKESQSGDESQAEEERATTIPKPSGQPGRPGSGGYCLEDALLEYGWSKQTFDNISVSDPFPDLDTV